MTGVILQARLSSARLPDKALLKLAGVPVIEHAMQALATLAVDRHVLATDEKSAEAFAPAARRHGFVLFAGDPADVLARYAAVVRAHGLQTVVRATGDNPAVSPRLADISLRAHRARSAEYTGLLGPPLGTCVEVIDAEALLAAEREATDWYDREHVAPYLYRNPQRFTVLRPILKGRYAQANARVTLDTQEDLELLARMYARLYAGTPLEIEQVIEWLRLHAWDRVLESRRA